MVELAAPPESTTNRRGQNLTNANRIPAEDKAAVVEAIVQAFAKGMKPSQIHADITAKYGLHVSIIYHYVNQARRNGHPALSPEGMPPKVKHRELGFEVRGKQFPDGSSKSIARFACKCGQVHDQTVNGRLNPEMIAKKTARDGWHVDPFKASATQCPSCIAGKAPVEVLPPPPLPRYNPDAGPKVFTTAATLDGHYASSSDAVADLMDEFEGMIEPVQAPPKPTPTARPPLPTPTYAPKNVTVTILAKTRRKVRTLLDGFFDDEQGRYLDGYSDLRVATEAEAPLEEVTAIREVGYGSLVERDPTLERFERRFAAIEAALEKLVKSSQN